MYYSTCNTVSLRHFLLDIVFFGESLPERFAQLAMKVTVHGLKFIVCVHMCVCVCVCVCV